MATTELEPPPVVAETSYVVVARKAREATGADDRLSFKTIASLIIVICVVATAPAPWSLVGVVASMVLAIEIAALAWKHRK